MNTMEKDFNFNTYRILSIITSKNKKVVGVAFCLSLAYSIIISYIGLLLGQAISIAGIIEVLIFFAATFFANVLIKQEYSIAINKDYDNRPPFAFLLLWASLAILYYLIVPQSLIIGNRNSLPILNAIAIVSVISAIVLINFYSYIFSIVMEFLFRFATPDILNKTSFVVRIVQKFEEAKRYGNKFSLVSLSFTIPPNCETKIKDSIIIPLFFDILKSNIRKSDAIGVLGGGRIAVILSNNNLLDGAEKQVTRLLGVLSNNEVLTRRLKVYKSAFKAGIVLFSDKSEDGESMVLDSLKAIQEALKGGENVVIIK